MTRTIHTVINLGIYHFDKAEYSKALTLLRKAKGLDNTTHIIDELINKADIQEPKKSSR